MVIANDDAHGHGAPIGSSALTAVPCGNGLDDEPAPEIGGAPAHGFQAVAGGGMRWDAGAVVDHVQPQRAIVLLHTDGAPGG